MNVALAKEKSEQENAKVESFKYKKFVLFEHNNDFGKTLR